MLRGGSRIDDLVALGIECDHVDVRPVAGVARPACWVVALGLEVERMASGAYTTLRGSDVKCFGALIVGSGDDESLDEALRSSSPGTVRAIDADGMTLRCGMGAVRVKEVQPSGKPRLTPLVWSRGRGLSVGDCFA